jgi:hypothetical protein
MGKILDHAPLQFYDGAQNSIRIFLPVLRSLVPNRTLIFTFPSLQDCAWQGK